MRATFAEIDLDALLYNFFLLQKYVGEEVDVLPVIKADAYGHGALPVARELIRAGARKIAVATLEEGVELRQAGFQVPIVILGGIVERQAPEVINRYLTPFIWDLKTVEALSQARRQSSLGSGVRSPGSKKRKGSKLQTQDSGLWTPDSRCKLRVHVKVDTGMGRLGIPYTEVLDFLKALSAYPEIEIEGLATHLATADEPDHAFTQVQVNRFRAVCNQVEEAGYQIPFYHIANSAGILSKTGLARKSPPFFNMVRSGIALYGIPPALHLIPILPLKPVMQLKTEIVLLKRVPAGTSIGYGRSFITPLESLVATIPVGYGDGYNRLLSNKGEVLVRGIRCLIIGRVCMDFCMVDVSLVPSVAVGDEVVLMGKQGTAQITAADISTWIGTIPYEVLCSVSRRVPRIYVKEGNVVCVREQDQIYRYSDE